MVEMGGLEPPTPYMRSSRSILTGPCSIRVFDPLSRFLPIVLPMKERVKNRLHGDLRLIAWPLELWSVILGAGRVRAGGWKKVAAPTLFLHGGARPITALHDNTQAFERRLFIISGFKSS
jgi:hypothetical protein